MGTIRPILENDAAIIARIYNYYIRETFVSFEEAEISTAEALDRIRSVTNTHPWIVYENDRREVLGYAYAAPFRTRYAYRHSLELSIYLDIESTGTGIGTQLMQSILEILVRTDCHALIGGIALPNDVSIRLHEKFGFEKVAHFPQVGRKFDKWIDVGFWQKFL